MQKHMLALVNGASAGVEAVEALLILAEWISHWARSSNRVARGEEDNVVWMYVGTAVRLAYLLDLDRVTLNQDNTIDDTRKRLAWAGELSFTVAF